MAVERAIVNVCIFIVEVNGWASSIFTACIHVCHQKHWCAQWL